MKKYKVVVTDDRYGSYEEENRTLSELGIQVEVHDFKSSAEAIPVLETSHGVLCNLFPLNREIIMRMNNCKVISRYGVGYDNVDLGSATAKGILVTNVPDYSIEDVSDHALALLLGCVRKIAYKDRRIREGEWNLHTIQRCYRIQGKTLGIIGFGRIARAFCRKTSGLGLKTVHVYDPYVSENEISNAGAVNTGLETLLRASDYLSIHVPLNDKTRNLIDDQALRKLKPGSIIINTSRGQVIVEEALFKALKDGRIAYAGLDVYHTEPLDAASPLRTLDNIILSDHAGWYSEESIVELKTKAARNILEILKGEDPSYPVNKEVLR